MGPVLRIQRGIGSLIPKAEISPGFTAGVRKGLTIFFGYFPAAVAYGLLARSSGLDGLFTIVFSLTTFAGASQFMAVNLIASGIPLIEVVLTIFFVNLRHLLMSSSLVPKIRFDSRLMIPVIAFGVTDETFAVASMEEEQFPPLYLLGLEITAYSGWISGSVVGYFSGALLPEPVQAAAGVVLYALFMALLVPSLKKGIAYLFIALIAAAVNTLCVSLFHMSSGWAIVIAMITAAGAGAVFFKEETA